MYVCMYVCVCVCVCVYVRACVCVCVCDHSIVSASYYVINESVSFLKLTLMLSMMLCTTALAHQYGIYF